MLLPGIGCGHPAWETPRMRLFALGATLHTCGVVKWVDQGVITIFIWPGCEDKLRPFSWLLQGWVSGVDCMRLVHCIICIRAATPKDNAHLPELTFMAGEQMVCVTVKAELK